MAESETTFSLQLKIIAKNYVIIVKLKVPNKNLFIMAKNYKNKMMY